MKTLNLFKLTIAVFAVLMSFNLLYAEILILSNNKKVHGSLTLIATDYIEFKTDDFGANTQWVKIPKKNILCITNDLGKIVYPRDKFDENALNHGKVKTRTREDVEKYRLRRRENEEAEKMSKASERNRYKTAALISLVGGVMALIFIGA